jgi:hypothetical protein
MKNILLIAGAAAIGLTAGAAQAVTHHHYAHTANRGAYALPAHPIAYADLNAYMKATPRERASRDWQTAAATGSSVNADAATAPAGATTATTDTNVVPAAAPAPTISPDVPAASAPAPANPAPSNSNARPATTPAPPAPSAATQPTPQ